MHLRPKAAASDLHLARVGALDVESTLSDSFDQAEFYDFSGDLTRVFIRWPRAMVSPTNSLFWGP